MERELGWSCSLSIPNPCCLRRIWEAESSSRSLCEILAASRFSHPFIRHTAHSSLFPEVMRAERLIVSMWHNAKFLSELQPVVHKVGKHRHHVTAGATGGHRALPRSHFLSQGRSWRSQQKALDAPQRRENACPVLCLGATAPTDTFWLSCPVPVPVIEQLLGENGSIHALCPALPLGSSMSTGYESPLELCDAAPDSASSSWGPGPQLGPHHSEQSSWKLCGLSKWGGSSLRWKFLLWPEAVILACIPAPRR